METDWVEDGKLVMRRAANPNMDVEVEGAIGAEQLQLRPVRFGPAGTNCNRASDREIETLSCADLDNVMVELSFTYC